MKHAGHFLVSVLFVKLDVPIIGLNEHDSGAVFLGLPLKSTEKTGADPLSPVRLIDPQAINICAVWVRNILGIKAFKGKGFSFDVPIRDDGETNVEFIMTYRGDFVTRLYISPGKFAHIPSKSGNAGYWRTGDRFIRIRNKFIKVTPYTKRLESRYEEEYRAYLEKSKRSYLLKWRMLYRLLKRFYKNVWLISDRPNKAGDNGEHLFRYICQQKPKGIRAYQDGDIIPGQRIRP